MTSSEIIAQTAAYEVGNYARLPVAFVRGKGAELWDAEERRYLDLFAGVAVMSLGHCHPRVVEAIQRQAATLMHVSNHYHNEPVAELVRLLCERSFAERVFLCNSGAEANEAAMKLARRWGADHGGGRFEIIATHASFHGRTFGTLTATGQEKYHRGFLPLLPGIRLAPFGDLGAMAAAIGPETVAIMIEPIQGEGGLATPAVDYLPGLRRLCDERGLLLILDEIQTGMGRTGRFCAYEHAGITPDIITLAKALGGGLPIGAMLATDRVASVLTPGSHGTTFGGNPVACAAARGGNGGAVGAGAAGDRAGDGRARPRPARACCRARQPHPGRPRPRPHGGRGARAPRPHARHALPRAWRAGQRDRRPRAPPDAPPRDLAGAARRRAGRARGG